MEILYKVLSYQIIGCVFDVFREIGPGYDEFTYHEALKVRFEKDGLQFKSKSHIQIYYRDINIADLEPDFIVEDKIILELKAIQTEFLPVNYTQIITYLRATDNRLGILINFGLLKADFKRVPFNERPLEIIEDFNEIVLIKGEQKKDFERLHNSIICVAKELRLGYHAEIYREAMKVELKLNDFILDEKVSVPVTFQDNHINDYEIDYWLINKKILFAALAGSKQVRAYDVMRMRSYLKNLGLNLGVIAFWGKDHLNILGVSPLR